MPDEVELLQQLIRFPTVNPPGNERACIEFVAALLADHGIRADTYALDPARPNLVARIPGRGQAPPLLLYGHVDVVPVEQQTWSVPPFSGLLKDGFVWGRGALDMKGGVAMLLSAFLRSKAQVPPGDVILVLLCDEEAGGAMGAEFMVREHPHLLEGVRHAIGEFGAFTLEIAGQRFFPIQIAEKRHCRLDITFEGSGGHASTPAKKTAVSKAARFLERLHRRPMPMRISPSAREMIRQLSQGMPRPMSRFFLRQLCNPAVAPVVLRMMGEKARIFEPLLRTLITPTILRAGVKLNVIPETVHVEFDVRMVPGQTVAEVEQHVRSLCDLGYTLSLEASDVCARPPDLSQFGLLAQIAGEIDSHAVAVPLLLPGVTDSRHFDAAGIQTYGFLPMVLPPGMKFMSLIHGPDERIPAATLSVGAQAILKFVLSYRG